MTAFGIFFLNTSIYLSRKVYATMTAFGIFFLNLIVGVLVETVMNASSKTEEEKRGDQSSPTRLHFDHASPGAASWRASAALASRRASAGLRPSFERHSLNQPLGSSASDAVNERINGVPGSESTRRLERMERQLGELFEAQQRTEKALSELVKSVALRLQV